MDKLKDMVFHCGKILYGLYMGNRHSRYDGDNIENQALSTKPESVISLDGIN